MEKVKFQNSRGLNLVGNFYPAESNSVIIMSHGFTGDKSEWGRFDKIAEALNKSGYKILTFDFSGCGESDDDTLAVDKQVDDLNSAIDYIKSRKCIKIGLFGHSLGGLISLKNYSKDIKAMVLSAPVTDKNRKTWDESYTEEQLQELEEKEYITKVREKGIRKKILIDKQMLIDRESVDQEALLSKVECPVLILHGDQDKDVPIEDSQNAIKYLPKSKLEIIMGGNHDFNMMGEVIFKTISWFKEYL